MTDQQAPDIQTAFLQAQQRARQKEEDEYTASRAPYIAAANKYLTDLAEHLASDIRQAIEEGTVGKTITRDLGEQPTVTFEDPSLKHVKFREVEQMSGYAKLNEVCAQEGEQGLCLGHPVDHRRDYASERGQPFSKVRIFIMQPYEASRYAEIKRIEAQHAAEAARTAEPTTPQRGLRGLLRGIRHRGPQ